jgi:hypothetical protein
MEAGHDFRAEVVCTLPPEHDADAITSDGHAVSFWQASDGSTTFARDGQAPHPPFDGIGQLRDGSPAIFPSPDGAHVAYQLRGIGVQEPPLNARFSPDGTRFAYFADVPEKGVAVVEDGVAGPVVKGVGWIVFSPDSRHVAYPVVGFDGQAGLVLDGTVGPTWDAKASVRGMAGPIAAGLATRRTLLAVYASDPGVRSPFSLAPDGEHPAWIGRFGAEWHPVLGDVVGPAFEAPLAVGSPWDGRAT